MSAMGGTESERLLRVAELAVSWGVTTWTIYALVNKGELRAVRVGRSMRIPASAVEEFIAKGGVPLAGESEDGADEQDEGPSYPASKPVEATPKQRGRFGAPSYLRGGKRVP